MGDHPYAEKLKEKLKENPDKSTGHAAIETLLERLKSSKARTARELNNELEEVVNEMFGTDYSYTSIKSAIDLFRRFITLAPAELLDQPDFGKVLEFYRDRGDQFLDRVAKSRELISKFSRPFFRSNTNVLTHSYSKVVLYALTKAVSDGANLHIWVTESQPDNSGRLMYSALKESGIPVTLILDSSIAYVMERMDAVVVGAEGVMETGGIINKIGTLTLAVCANSMNKPFYVMSESIKFVKEYPLNQSDIPKEFKYSTSVLREKNLDIEHPAIDYTPPQYISLLFTDLGILTAAAVGEELIRLYT